jgi:hypothetical protein
MKIRRLVLPSGRLRKCHHCNKLTSGRCSVCRRPVCSRCWHISREFHLEVRRRQQVWEEYEAQVDAARRDALRRGDSVMLAILL